MIFFPGDFFVFEKTESKFSELLFGRICLEGMRDGELNKLICMLDVTFGKMKIANLSQMHPLPPDIQTPEKESSYRCKLLQK